MATLTTKWQTEFQTDGFSFLLHSMETVEAGILKGKAVPNVLFVTWKYVRHNLQKSHYTLHSEIEWLLCVCFWALLAVVSIVWLCVIAGCEV